MFTKSIAVSGNVSLGTVSPHMLGGFVFQTSGCSASNTLTPQIRLAEGGGTWVNCQYKNLATQAVVTAGTAIVADGVYTFIADGCEGNLNAVAATTFTVNVWPLEGAGS